MMKTQNYGLLIFSFLQIGLAPSNLWAQQSNDKPEPVVFHAVRYIEVDKENRAAFVKAVEEKTRKYNADAASSQWWTYQILNGPRSNMFARGFGRVTADELDSPKFKSQGFAPDWDAEEAQYWKKHIQPLEKSAGKGELWREIAGTEYRGLPEKSKPRFVRHRKWKMLPGMYQRLESHYQKLTKAIAASKRPVDWCVARLEMGGDFMTYSETIAFNKLGDILMADQVGVDFDMIHGEGAWKKWLQEHARIMQPNAEVITEVWEYKPTMSNSALGK
jgi:hypothetical protein